MTGAFSFASFSRTAGRSGGWGIGELKGAVTPEQAQRLQESIPSTISDGTDPGNYPSKEVLAQLARRFSWLPNGDAGAGYSFYASAQAGKDSTNRPGNIFTFVQVCADESMGIYQPAEFLYSEEIPTPFGKNQVDRAEIPERLVAPGPITTEVIDYFLDGWLDQNPLPIHFQAVQPDSRRRLAQSIAAATVSRQVVLACPLPESALWVAAVSHMISYPRGFSFSTFETPDRIEYILRSGCKLSIVDIAQARNVAAKLSATDVLFIQADAPDWNQLAEYQPNEDSELLSTEIPSLDSGPSMELVEQSLPTYQSVLSNESVLLDPLPQPLPLPLNGRVAAPEPFERSLIASAEVYEYLQDLYSQTDNTNAWVAKVVRIHELLTLDPADDSSIRLRAAFLALVLLQGHPQYWFGVQNFVTLTDVEEAKVVGAAKNCILERLMAQKVLRSRYKFRVMDAITYHDNPELSRLLEMLKNQVIIGLDNDPSLRYPSQY